MTYPILRTILAATLVSASALGTATAATGRWDTAAGPGSGNGATSATPWIAAPAAGSLYAEWNFFDDGNPATLEIEDATPDIAAAGLGAASAQLTETTGSAFVTGGGNIYSPAFATAFTVTLPGGGSGTLDVWLRVATLGSLLSTAATLNGVSATAQETFGANISGGFGGNEKEWLWHWTLPSAGAYTFAFEASASSVSLDQAAVYLASAPVPEPGTYALLGLGLLTVGSLARKRRR